MTNAVKHRRRRIFVAMPFREEHNPIYSVVREAVGLIGADVVRIDEESFAGSIISKIRSEIDGADLVTAIVSEENGNVYYEIGLAHCQKKPVVLLTSDPHSLKFDLRDHRAIVYDPGAPAGIRDELVRTIRSVIDLPSDPEAYLASAFKGTDHFRDALTNGVEKILLTIAADYGLQFPVHLKSKQLIADNKMMAIEVRDFMNKAVRAVVDINGIIVNSGVI